MVFWSIPAAANNLTAVMAGKGEEIMQEFEALEKIYRKHLQKVSSLDATGIEELLAIDSNENGIEVPVFGFPHQVTPGGITNHLGEKPGQFLGVILCKYLLGCPAIKPRGDDWVTYKDFQDSTPFVEAFMNNIERPVAEYFSGRLADLETACNKLGASTIDVGVSSDLAKVFYALPQIPVLMLLNDQDEDLPATCSILFERRAAIYLDMECLAMLGMLLFEWLRLCDPSFNTTNTSN